jgi:hypothetical protein
MWVGCGLEGDGLGEGGCGRRWMTETECGFPSKLGHFRSQYSEYGHPRMGLGMLLGKDLPSFGPSRRRLPSGADLVHDLDCTLGFHSKCTPNSSLRGFFWSIWFWTGPRATEINR